MTPTPRAPANVVSMGWCRAWDGAELICDLAPGHGAAHPREHRAHVQQDGTGPYLAVYFDADGRREPVRELPDPIGIELLDNGSAVLNGPITPGDRQVPPGDRQWDGKVRKRKLRVAIADDTVGVYTIESHLAAIARLSSAANGAGVPIREARMRLVLGLNGRVRAAWFYWEVPA